MDNVIEFARPGDRAGTSPAPVYLAGLGDDDGAGGPTPGRLPVLGRWRDWRDEGMATAEYAIATLAAAGFAGLLLVLLRSGEVRSLLFGIIRRALSVG